MTDFQSAFVLGFVLAVMCSAVYVVVSEVYIRLAGGGGDDAWWTG